ncbi:hypothetical protein ABE527_02210 [Brucella sp. TWI432]
MSFSTFLEKLAIGPKAVKQRRNLESELSNERERLQSTQQELQAEVRQHEQIVTSASRVLRNMTHAMILVEADSGKRKK